MNRYEGDQPASIPNAPPAEAAITFAGDSAFIIVLMMFTICPFMEGSTTADIARTLGRHVMEGGVLSLCVVKGTKALWKKLSSPKSPENIGSTPEV